MNNIIKIYRAFWDDKNKVYTSMAGMADVWEGPGEKTYAGASTILGMQYFNDKLFIVQGGGRQTIIKVVTPNGIEVHLLGAQACLMTHTAQDLYGSICVINENELIVGYLYVNLEMQFAAPYGLDLTGLWNNPSVKITSSRINSTAWVTATRSAGSVQFFMYQKSSPEDCLPCKTKKKFSKIEFECVEEKYSKTAMKVDSYYATRDMIEDGVSLSITDEDSVGSMKRKPMPVSNPEECIKAMGEYTSVFNNTKISPSDVGEIGQKLSSNCSKIMYGNMLEITEYRRLAEKMNEDYIASFILGDIKNDELKEKSIEAVALIVPILSEMSNTSKDSTMISNIFRDKIWWGPIWFASNDIPEGKNAYTNLYSINEDDFMSMISNSATSIDPLDESQPLPMGWVVMASKDRTPVKYGKNSMTYFRFPFASCISCTKLFELPERDVDSICDVETRGDGVIIWAWKDVSALGQRMDMELKCYKISNDGVSSHLATEHIGEGASPIDNSAKTAMVSDDNKFWIIRDYFLSDGELGIIDFTEVKVGISSDMTEVMNAGNTSNYANVNEVSGNESGATGSIHYSDGMLENNYSPYDLDDNEVSTSSGGPSYDWVNGYSGYKIKEDL